MSRAVSPDRRPAIRLGVPRETFPGERRVAATPDTVKKLLEQGFEVLVERGAGERAGYDDAMFTQAGAQLGDRAEALGAHVVLKVRPPSVAEAEAVSPSATVISLLYPQSNEPALAALEKKKASALALERIPRITRAQKMDVLSSMANLVGYRAVVEAAAAYPGFFAPQVTAAGTTPPARVLIIGAGVAGLAAVGAARALGAEVRAFDTRSAAREQVESLGAAFLEVKVQESGEGQGGYAKTMSKEFIEAEMALFRAQAKEVDVIITTALVPGTKAPLLLPKDVVEHLKPGSVVVDLAAEQGGNCELTRADEVVQFQGISILGFTDLASRMARTSSKFFAQNLVHLLAEMGGGKAFRLDLESEVVRPALVMHLGERLAPPPPKPPSPAPAPKPAAAAPVVAAKPAPARDITKPGRRAWGATLGGMVVLGLLFVLGRFAPSDFLQHSTVFILACFVGWQVVWSVSPALHTPLMSVTNAISGIIIVGGLLQVGQGFDLASILGVLAVLVAAVNIAGGFLVTQRMLKMFRRDPGQTSSSGGHSGAHR